MSAKNWLMVLFALLLLPTPALPAVQNTFCVAPDGNDDNPGTEAKPFATLEKARQAVRAVNKDMTGDIVVVLRGGTYQIAQTIAFDAADSGTGGHNVIYKAQAGESPVISGGTRVTGWQRDEKGRWKASAPGNDFRQLYVHGVRATRAKGPPPAGITLQGNDGYKTMAVDMATWKNPSDLEFCYVATFTVVRCKVAGIRREGDHAIITMLQPYFTHARTKEATRAELPTYVENALELLDEPGEWYLDRSAKTVYYMPRQGEDMNKVEVIAPALDKLIELRGTLNQPVHNIHFAGITFRHGNWLRPSKIGHCEVQANFIFDSGRKDSFTRTGSIANLHSEYVKSPANVVCHAAKLIRFERCTFNQLGGAGLDIEFGSQDNMIIGCRFFDIAGSAVQIGDVLKDDHHPDDPRKIVKNNSVENCYIHDCCADYPGGVGVFAGYTEGTRIAHNEICRLPYSGISVGWGWGEEDVGGGGYPQPFYYDKPTPAKNNRIEMNHIHHVMQTMDDGGGIYTLGNQPGTIIRGNHVHDNLPGPGRTMGPGGIYLDEGSGFIEVTNNLVYNMKAATFFNNHAQNRISTCKVHDNFSGSYPDAAKPIAEKAGLKADYRDLLKGP